MHKDTLKFIDAWLSINWRADNLPGLSVGIVEDKKPVFSKGYGFANIKTKKPITDKTLFRIASISKVFTAIAILQLEEKKKLKISDPVSKHLPSFQSKANSRLDKITIKDLLIHTSKLTRDGQGLQWDTDKYPNDKMLLAELEKPAHFFKSKHKFKYSNFGYSILGLIIEAVSKQTYESYIQQNIIKPLNMLQTTSSINKKVVMQLATGYSKDFLGAKITQFKHPHTHAMAAATGVSSNINDLNKFALAILNQSPKLLKPQTWKRAFVQQWIYEKQKRNLLMFSFGTGKSTTWGHGGGFQGYSTNMNLNLKAKVGVNVMINQIMQDGFYYARMIHKIIADMPKVLKKSNKYPKVTPKANEYVGIYNGRWGVEQIITINNRLIAFHPVSYGAPTDAISFLEYTEKDSYLVNDNNPYNIDQQTITFLRNKQGKVVACALGGSAKYKVS